jgi:hypothetical protein
MSVLEVFRDEFLPTCIRGRLLLNGADCCRTLEPPWQGNAPGKSCIPAGTYGLRLSRSQRFGRLLPELLDVPGRSMIRIHAGNGPGDTEGCILVGPERGPYRGMPGLLYPARRSETILVSRLLELVGRDGLATITIWEERG